MLLTGNTYLDKLLLSFTILYSHFFSLLFFSFSHFSYDKSPLVGYFIWIVCDFSSKSTWEGFVFWWFFLIFLIICGTNYLFYIPESFSSGYTILPSNLKLNYTYMKFSHLENSSRYFLLWFTFDFLIIFGLNYSIIQQALIEKLGI